MNDQANGRVIGFDCHPDTFTAAVIRGQTPAAAIVEKIYNKLPMGQLESWAKKNLGESDLVVMEASGNSFQTTRRLEAQGRKALVLESCQMGKLKEAHANNDKISAVRIGKAFLAGTAKIVWVPDPATQERRDWFHAHRKAVKRVSQMRSRIDSYLSDNGVRLRAKTPLAQRLAKPHTCHPWSENRGTNALPTRLSMPFSSTAFLPMNSRGASFHSPINSAVPKFGLPWLSYFHVPLSFQGWIKGTQPGRSDLFGRGLRMNG